jgi:hypothetical protein
LCSVRLLTEVELRFGRSVPLADFFAAPTLARLQQLVDDTGSPPTAGAAPSDAIPWPLPPELHHRLNSYFATWDGERPTRDRLVAGLNTAGARPPLFWVFQDAVEFRRLAAHLGPEQPLYALRSGHLIISSTDEDAIQTLALRYASEIIEARPAGPLFLGGNCQGGIIALAAAQHLLRRGRHVPLLVLMEWGFPLQPYPGPVLLLYGHDSAQANPHKRHRHPQLAWRRVFADYAVAEIRGAHGTFFDEGNVEILAATLGRHLREAASRVPRLLPMLARRAELAANDLPVRMRMGERRWVDVRVRNSSPVAWDAWERSGLALGNYWMDPAGAIVERVDGRAALPALGPGGEVRVRLSVTAPAVAGTLLLIIDVVEEGNTWFDLERASALRSTVTIA